MKRHRKGDDGPNGAAVCRDIAVGGETPATSGLGDRLDATAQRAALHAARRLALVLDLDHTLVHSSTDERLAPLVDAVDPDGLEVRRMELRERHLFTGARRARTYYVALRPYLRGFLRAVDQHFDLYVYTKAQRCYAVPVLKLFGLDRAPALTADEDDGPLGHKDLRQLFLGDPTTVVLDDGDVWGACKNVVKARPFVAFLLAPGVARLRGCACRDDFLRDLAPWLLRVHARYYAALDAGADPDVRTCLAQERAAVLDGVVLAYAGVFPRRPAADTPAWALAEALGARNEAGPAAATHVVAAHTPAAVPRGAVVVSPGWLLHAFQYLRRPPEAAYPAETNWQERAAVRCGGEGAPRALWPALAWVVRWLEWHDVAAARLVSVGFCAALDRTFRKFCGRGFAPAHHATMASLYFSYVAAPP